MATPTPIVCTDLGALTDISIAPGQRFDCATHQDTLAAGLRSVPELPCRDLSITLDDEQFAFVCQARIEITVQGLIKAEDCQLDIEITRGTLGLAGVIQLLIDTLLGYFPYETLCFEQVKIDDGEMVVSGYGR